MGYSMTRASERLFSYTYLLLFTRLNTTASDRMSIITRYYFRYNDPARSIIRLWWSGAVKRVFLFNYWHLKLWNNVLNVLRIDWTLVTADASTCLNTNNVFKCLTFPLRFLRKTWEKLQIWQTILIKNKY